MNKQDENWVVTCTYSDEEIKEYGEEILASPAMTISVPSSEVKLQALYDEDQMLRMFREGCLTILREKYKKKSKKNSKPPRPFPILRDMAVGESVNVPFEKWQAARSAASKLKRDFGCVFVVRKVAKTGEIGEIEIYRKA